MHNILLSIDKELLSAIGMEFQFISSFCTCCITFNFEFELATQLKDKS